MKNEKESSPSAVSLLLLLLVLVTAGVIILKDKSEIEQLKQKQSALNETLEVRDSVINEMLNTFGKIEQNLSFVRNKRNEMILLVQESGKNWQEILVADVRLMNYLLEISSRQTEEKINKPKSGNFEMIWLKSENARLSNLINVHENSLKYLNTESGLTDFQITPKELQLAQLKSEIDQRTDTVEIKPQIIASKTFTFFE
jgi:hypothetical protein